jgi:hypothetical protein
MSRPERRLLDQHDIPRTSSRPAGRVDAPGLLPQTDVDFVFDGNVVRIVRGNTHKGDGRDWAAEATAHPNHVVEQALAHAIGPTVEAAYRRGDLIEKRRALMADWANYLAKPAAQVLRPRFGEQHAAHEGVA